MAGDYGEKDGEEEGLVGTDNLKMMDGWRGDFWRGSTETAQAQPKGFFLVG